MLLNNKRLPSLLHQLLFNHWLRKSNKKKGNQRDGLWLARMNLATHSCHSNTVYRFKFLWRLAPGCLDGFSIGRYEEKRESFDLFATGFESGAMRFLRGKSLRHWSPFKTWIPPLSFYYKEQSTAKSNSFKIAQKTAFEVKRRLYTTGKVIQCLFIIDLYT